VKRLAIIAAAGVLVLWLGAVSATGDAAPPAASGRVVDGIREVDVAGAPQGLRLTVYRGDYVRFRLTGSDAPPVLSIPDLSIHQTLTGDPAAYIKMEKPGVFAFALGAARGTIAVVEFRRAAYREVTPAEFAALIRAGDPLLLDVRTPAEYGRGRIHKSVLIPLSQLEGRLAELSAFKDRPVLIYCATGNRSTVAAKILIDHGFSRVFNLRAGINGWEREKLPVVR
jgi:rhodanese-related sulfurtransferase